MNKEIKQILKNQATILLILSKDENIHKLKLGELMSVGDRMQETQELLNPPKQPTIAERTHDALCEKDCVSSTSSEVKK